MLDLPTMPSADVTDNALIKPKLTQRANERLLRAWSRFMRGIPFNRKIKGLCIRVSRIWARQRFDFEFDCPRIGVRWSAAGFPDLLTRHMMFEGMYQQDVLVSLQSLLKRGDTVFDVGSHHGLMAVVAGLAVSEQGRVVAFEPNPSARRLLNHHVLLNRLKNVVVEEIALSDREDGHIPFYVQSGDVTWNSTILREFARASDTATPLQVPTRTLDRYVAEAGCVPSLVKIDVEGAEFMILKGARKTIESHRPIFIVEFNPASARAASVTVDEMVRFFRANSYSLVTLRRSALGFYRFEDKIPFSEEQHCKEDSLANVICLPQKSA